MRLERILDIVVRVLATALLVSIGIAALSDVSRAWDVWSYHLPFAARIANIVSREQFVFHSADEARYRGFTLLCECLQGVLWRVTHRPESANLVAFASVPLVGSLLHARFGVPFRMTVLGLLAVPLIQIHSTSCYVDLPANSAAAVLCLFTIRAFVRRESPTKWTILGVFGAAAFAANSKSLLHPIVLLSLLAFGTRVLQTRPRTQWARALVLMVALSPLVFATPLKNLALHGNPYYPVRVSVAGVVFDGPEAPYSSSPDWLRQAPRQLRFAASVLEFGARPLTNSRRWTMDQWAPLGDRGYRMGGYFGAYVAAQLVILLGLVVRGRSREVRVVALGFAVLTALVASLPQSHELRYYMVWVIVLVCSNLWLAVLHDKYWPAISNLVSTLAIAVVLWVTNGGYVYPSGASFTELLREQTSEKRIATVPDGGTACIAREPFNLLWAAPFHKPRRYTLKEVERSSECGGLPSL